MLKLETDEGEFFGNRVKLNSTSSGHYFIPLIQNFATSIDAFVTSDRPIFVTDKQLLKLHIQFGHSSIPALERLLRNGKVRFRQENLKSVLPRCQTCRLHSVSAKIPMVSLPISSEPNEVISIDLHQLGPFLWYLHMICLYSHFSLPVSVTPKKPDVIISAFVKTWVSVFGRSTKGILTDNGGDKLAEGLSLKVLTTAAYSPQNNGTCERHNRTVAETLRKVRED